MKAVISPKGTTRVRSGHLWIYKSDVLKAPQSESGSIVRVEDKRGTFLAWSHYGRESEISLRILSTDITDEPNHNFWKNRLLRAYEWRKQILDSKSNAYRLVHSEGDYLSGLIIDRYKDSFVLQTLTRGMDGLKSMWVELLVNNFNPDLIIERNDAKVRNLEGLPLINSVLYKSEKYSEEETIILENGIKYKIDLLEGQKTGSFLDQRENRKAAMQYARGRGLDCFSFHGSFALHLAGKCEQVTALDISLPAIQRASANAELNGISNVDFLETNVFDKLRDYDDNNDRFDTIVLDPPAFAKNRGSVPAAVRGYKEINLRALKLLNPGGILITCSCSYHVGEALFLDILKEAILDSGRKVQIIEKRTQSRDHPILPSMPETYYLKCIVLRVID